MWVVAFLGLRRARPPRAVELAQDLLEAIERPVEILRRDDQRRRQPNDRVMGLLRQHALRPQSLASLARTRNTGINLGADPQAAAADRFQCGTVERAQPPEHVRAERAALLHQTLVAQHIEGFKAD